MNEQAAYMRMDALVAVVHTDEAGCAMSRSRHKSRQSRRKRFRAQRLGRRCVEDVSKALLLDRARVLKTCSSLARDSQGSAPAGPNCWQSPQGNCNMH